MSYNNSKVSNPTEDAPPPPPEGAPPPPTPWAFEAAYNQPLPSSFAFAPRTGFGEMVNTLSTAYASRSPALVPRVNPYVATYKDAKDKTSWVGMEDLTPTEKAEYARGATLSGATKEWRAGGSVGLVTSCMSSASSQSQGQNNWHTVAMARNGSTVWVHDSEYNAAEHAGNVKRVDGVHGTGNVHRLIHQWAPVQGVYFQGPPPSYVARPGQLECMGRSAQWVDAILNGTLPWPPNRDPSGGEWTFHYRN
jgi:hypothetical protein